MKSNNDKREKSEQKYGRRTFVKKALFSIASLLVPGFLAARETKQKENAAAILAGGYNPYEHHWGMGIDIGKCIGCGRCVEACKEENNVPREPFFFRTWVERYRVLENGETVVDSPNGAINGFDDKSLDEPVVRSFFVPKLCNHCDNPPCVQVCPVGATFKSPDGVVLVDPSYCIGCRYCIQACPYGARFLHPETRTAEKCTFCYHRITRGLLPACVEACPTQARLFGELHKKANPLQRFLRMNKVAILKPDLNTEPKVFYTNFDMEVS
ncbi:MAG: 4Fe-4S dicluster domain-containing protein [Candidatus Latescibacterota bacterium]|nr:MAG: 4Fe-4S dicluster domain-containing protein [Candidatus Latescibacterota bacterium]